MTEQNVPEPRRIVDLSDIFNRFVGRLDTPEERMKMVSEALDLCATHGIPATRAEVEIGLDRFSRETRTIRLS